MNVLNIYNFVETES